VGTLSISLSLDSSHSGSPRSLADTQIGEEGNGGFLLSLSSGGSPPGGGAWGLGGVTYFSVPDITGSARSPLYSPSAAFIFLQHPWPATFPLCVLIFVVSTDDDFLTSCSLDARIRLTRRLLASELTRRMARASTYSLHV